MAAASRASAGPAPAQPPPRGPGGARPSLPVPNPRDLFSPKAVEEAMQQRPNELQYLCELPRWTYARPGLTGLDLIMVRRGVGGREGGRKWAGGWVDGRVGGWVREMEWVSGWLVA